MFTVILINCKEREESTDETFETRLSITCRHSYVHFRWQSVQVDFSVNCQHTVFVWHTFCYCQPISLSLVPHSSSPLGRYRPKAVGLFRPRYSCWGIRCTLVWPPVPRSFARKSAGFLRRCRILNVCML